MKVRKILSFLVLGAISSAALADWQYTTWQMNKDDVVKASGGRATNTGHGELVAPYQAGDFIFNAHFDFDKKTRLLINVRLELLTDKQEIARSLLESLKSKYGKPDEESHSHMGSIETGMDAKWRTEKDEIYYVVFPTGDVWVGYSPRENANTQGL